MKISAVTFDVWETLIKDTLRTGGGRAQSRASRMAEVVRRHGYSLDPSVARQVYDQTVGIIQREFHAAYSDISTREQLGIFLSAIDPSLASTADETLLAELDQAYTAPFFDFPPSLAPGAERALSQVRLKGLRIGLVCNTGVTPGRDIRKLLDRFGILDYFQSLAFSDELGVRKPKPEIFHWVLRHLGVSPSEAVHVGDDAVSDIAGAKGAGMKAIMVRSSPPPQLPVLPDQRVDDLIAVPEALERL